MVKILILGGGFGGIYCAKRLQKIKLNSFDIELISDNNYFIFQPLLPEVASGAISESDAVTPIRQMLDSVKFRNAEINEINLGKKKVGILQGFRKRQHFISYDHLVIALGQESNLDIIPGLRNNSMTMKNLKDAYNIRNHIIHCLELADVTKDYNLKKRLLNFVVVGGGFSGVETVGELKEMVNRLLKYYKRIKKSEINFHIIELSKRLLPELDKSLGLYTNEIFKREEIKVHLNVSLKEVTSLKVYLSNKKFIETNTVISTIGSTISDLIKKSDLPLKNGRILTKKSLEILDNKNVWAVGDCAFVPENSDDITKSCPPTAQFAVRQAKILAKNIVLRSLNRKLKHFSYKSKGSLASLGAKKGVGKIYSYTIKGLLAWIIWRVFYLSFIPSVPTKIRVLIGWILEFFIPRNAVLTDSLANQSFEFKNFKKDDIVFTEGMIADGFYIVQSGEFINTYKKTKDGNVFRKIYKKGDHFGSRVILEGGRRTGTIKATKDSEVLKIEKESFKLMASNLPALKNYFNEYLPKNFKSLKLTN